jgi:hypothetical protein
MSPVRRARGHLHPSLRAGNAAKRIRFRSVRASTLREAPQPQFPVASSCCNALVQSNVGKGQRCDTTPKPTGDTRRNVSSWPRLCLTNTDRRCLPWRSLDRTGAEGRALTNAIRTIMSKANPGHFRGRRNKFGQRPVHPAAPRIPKYPPHGAGLRSPPNSSARPGPLVGLEEIGVAAARCLIDGSGARPEPWFCADRSPEIGCIGELGFVTSVPPLLMRGAEAVSPAYTALPAIG